MQDLLKRLAGGGPLLLDGATGTELQRRGVPTLLPLWSASALLQPGSSETLERIHADYVTAGAEVLTANTFRTHARNLSAAGLESRAAELTARAVGLARRAAAGRAWVAGSQAPLEDCYSPQLVPPQSQLVREHREMAAHLADAGVDLILVETQNTIREAVAATTAAVKTGLPVLVSFVCGEDGRLLSGQSLTDAARAVLPLGANGLLVNCGPAPTMLATLIELRAASHGLPCGVYANVGRADPVQGWVNTDAHDPGGYAGYARRWLTEGARLVGGCCGTTPEHIRQLRRLLDVLSD
jgi:S-methylmethionine-dependent homocysteine/selenocysteine methylase